MKKYIILSLILLLSVPTQSIYSQTRKPGPRCEAITQKCTRCKLEAMKGSKYCYVHLAKDPNVKQCKAYTKSGKRCSRADAKGGYCLQHYKMHLQGKL